MAKTNTKGSGSSARSARAKVIISAIKSALPKGSKIVSRTVRHTLLHKNVAQGIVCSCFARRDFCVVLLPVFGKMLKVNDLDRNGTPFTHVADVAQAKELGERLATCLNTEA